MATDVLERPDTDTTDTDDREKFFHYVKKGDIAQSAVEGTHVKALCGKRFQVTKAAKPDSPVCPDCKRIYDMMNKGE